MIMAIEEKAEVALAAPLAVPAVLLNRKFGREPLGRVEIKTVVEGRIEKPLVVPEMVNIGHRQDARAVGAKDFQKQAVDVLIFGLKLVEQSRIVVAARGGGLKRFRHVLQCARKVKNHPLAAELALRHRLPVPREPLVAGAFGPNVGESFGFLLIPHEFAFVVGIAEVLNLEALVLVEGRQEKAKLVLEVVQVGDGRVREVGSLEDESLRHVTAAPQMIEDHQITDEETVGGALEHGQSRVWDNGCSGRRSVSGPKPPPETQCSNMSLS